MRVVLPYQLKKPVGNRLPEEVAVTGADEMVDGRGEMTKHPSGAGAP